MPYTPVGWEDVPSEKTPIDADNLNHMDEQIKANADALVPASTEKIGLVKPDGETITVDEDGTIHSSGGGVDEQEIIDLKMLGWTVPKEMPVKNYTDSNGVYHQRVGRRGLWECDWYYDYDGSVFYASNIIGTKNGADFICKGYSNCGYIAVNSMPNMSIQIRTNGTYLKNTSYADVTAFKNAMKQQGVYLYYELATEITIPIDGNEATTNQMLSDEWISGKIYAQGNFAIYKNKLWKSKVDNNTGNTPAEGSYWTATNVGNEINTCLSVRTFYYTKSIILDAGASVTIDFSSAIPSGYEVVNVQAAYGVYPLPYFSPSSLTALIYITTIQNNICTIRNAGSAWSTARPMHLILFCNKKTS